MARVDFQFSATVTGLPEQSTGSESAGFFTTASSTNVVGDARTLVATTGSTGFGSATPIPVSTKASYLVIIPTRSTNASTAGLRVTMDTATSGVYVGYRRPTFISVESTAETTYHVYTTGNTTTPFRALIL